jgi:hypothetical protein
MEHGAWSREQGAGSVEQGAWSREQGAWRKEIVKLLFLILDTELRTLNPEL